jgi:hypothetical protein
MQSKPIRRRDVLHKVAVFIGASYLASQSKAGQCVPIDDSSAGLRASLHYVDASPDAAHRCSGCSFFSNPKDTCGECAIFNGPTDANGHCDSWAART